MRFVGFLSEAEPLFIFVNRESPLLLAAAEKSAKDEGEEVHLKWDL